MHNLNKVNTTPNLLIVDIGPTSFRKKQDWYILKHTRVTELALIDASQVKYTKAKFYWTT